MTLLPRRAACSPALAMAVALCGLAGHAAGETTALGNGPVPSASPNGYLAHVPLDSLTATRERPLFAPTRRPPPAAAPPVAQAPRPVLPAPVEPPPRLTLLGIIRSSEGGALAVVRDEATHASISLKLGDDRGGWVVRAIDADSLTLEKQQRSTTLHYPPAQTHLPAPPPIDD